MNWILSSPGSNPHTPLLTRNFQRLPTICISALSKSASKILQYIIQFTLSCLCSNIPYTNQIQIFNESQYGHTCYYLYPCHSLHLHCPSSLWTLPVKILRYLSRFSSLFPHETFCEVSLSIYHIMLGLEFKSILGFLLIAYKLLNSHVFHILFFIIFLRTQTS